jgi:hypothetical protein
MKDKLINLDFGSDLKVIKCRTHCEILWKNAWKNYKSNRYRCTPVISKRHK